MGTIKSSREIDTVFREAKRAAHPLIIVLATKTPEGRGHMGRVAFIAGKKLGNAVVRNRSKRVLRAATQRCEGPWRGYDILLIARPSTRDAACGDLDSALQSQLSRLGITL
ncbi:MAG: ribonuclease P protein component [Coriobacteriia bacterium]